MMSIKNTIYRRFIPFIGTAFSSPNIIPVIYYHDVVSSGLEYSLMRTNVDVFHNHMKFLNEEGYNTLLFKDVSKSFNKPKSEKTVLITFDDGFVSNYELVMPIIKEYGLNINIFLVPDFINKTGYLSIDQIKEMVATKCVQFGCHTYSHCDCRKEFNDYEYHKEFIESKQVIEDITSEAVCDFCFPFGYYNKHIIERLSTDGIYKNLYLSNYIKPTLVNSSTVTGRIGIDTTWDTDMFRNQINGKYRVMHYYSILRVGVNPIK